jgi:hypothetical protein
MFFSAENKSFIGSPIWPDCVEVSDVTAAEIMELVGKGYSLEADAAGLPVAISPGDLPAPDIRDRFDERLDTLNSDYEVAFSMLRDTYPLSETTTWTIQSDEAVAFDAWRTAGRIGSPPLTPLLTDLTAARGALGVGAGLEDLVNRVLNNTNIYIPAVAILTAKRHAAEQSLTIARMQNDFTALNAVTWEFSFSLIAEPTVVTPPPAEEI